MIQLDSQYNSRLVYNFNVHNHLKYLKDKKCSKEDYKKFEGN